MVKAKKEKKDCGVCHEHSGHTAKITRIEWCLYALICLNLYMVQHGDRKFDKLTDNISELGTAFNATATGHEKDLAHIGSRVDFNRAYCCGELPKFMEATNE